MESGLNVFSVQIHNHFIFHTNIYLCLLILLPNENNHHIQKNLTKIVKNRHMDGFGNGSKRARARTKG
ncbi:hypothetical protein Hanom_Chr13g01192001 [Helianthus anomalus]